MRQDLPRGRTDRPVLSDVLPTVREVLALDAVADGVPEVIVGGDALDAQVRWVHASDSAGVGRLLDGGELLLSTGSAWPADPAALEAFVASLADAGISCLVLELGVHHAAVPAAVAATAQDKRLALVVLHREVKFVSLTETIHRRIMSEQSAALRARDEVRERFTALALRGSPPDFIVHQLAQTLGAPVVLEDLSHDVVSADVPLAREEDLFTGWEARSRAARGTAVPGDDSWLIVPVEARGVRWGYLVALPGPRHPAGRASVLEQGAIALALGRLAAPDGDDWTRNARRRLVDGLLAGRFAGYAGAAARVEAAGLPVDGRYLYGVVTSGATVPSDAADAAARTLGGRALTGSAPTGVDEPAATHLVSLPAGTPLDHRSGPAFARALRGDGAGLVVTIGPPARSIETALRSLQEAIDLSPGGRDTATSGPLVLWTHDRPLGRLVAALRDDQRMLEHGERMLAPLVDHDLARRGDLLAVLGAIVAHPGNRTAAASASHLSRSVFYQRIALIEQLLDVDLDDGETLAALHLALLVRRAAKN